MTDVHVTPVPLSRLEPMWPHAKPWLAMGMTTAPEVSWDDIIHGIFSHTDKLWVVIHGAECIGAFMTAAFDGGEMETPFLAVYCLGGSRLSLWSRLIEEATVAEARAQNLPRVLFHGREAWSRVLPAFRPIQHMGGGAIFERAV
jgi:hypothetical protein